MTFKVKSGIRVNTVDVIDSNGNFTGNAYQGITPVDIPYGGTNATTAANARINIFADVSTGLVNRKSDGTVVSITLAEGTGVGITNADGDSGNPTISIGQNVAPSASVVFADLSLTEITTGLVVRNSSGNLISRTLAEGTGISITNTDGNDGNPTISIGQNVSTTADVTFANVTVNGQLFSNDITATSITAQGDLTVTGNLTILGDTTTVNSETVNIEDNELILNSNLDNATAPTLDALLTVNRGSSANVSLRWDETTADRWQFTNNGTDYFNIPTPDEYDNTLYTVSVESVTGGANLRLTGTNQITSATVTDDVTFVGAGLVTVSRQDENTIVINAGGSLSSKIIGITDSVANVIDYFSITEYRSAEYFYTVDAGTEFATGKIIVLHNGTSTWHNQYGMLQTDDTDELVSFQTEINSGNVRLIAQATSGNTANVTLTSTSKAAI